MQYTSQQDEHLDVLLLTNFTKARLFPFDMSVDAMESNIQEMYKNESEDTRDSS